MFDLLSFFDNYDGGVVSQWMVDHLEVPTLAAGFYLFLIMQVPDMMKDRAPMKLKTLNIVWNLFLTVFSFAGAYYCVPRMLDMVFSPTYQVPDVRDASRLVTREGSFYNAVCVWYPTQFYTGRIGFFVALFILSKIPEMIDTVFLVLKKKPVIFLHWYHHITVMLYCWHAYAYHVSSGLLFSSMNYFVHSIMYFYYFVAACGYTRQLRPIAPLITVLQIAQMVVGGFAEVYSLYHLYVSGRGCEVNSCNARLGFLMYASYFLLFSKLFKDKYFPPKKAPVVAAAAADGVLENGEKKKKAN
ncbi:beta-ketoacyl-CoA synthase [Strigomonas culicis]|uniref:Elongation of fatty acids protein n=1 Tax=Strigomonas culicis TaxID=28005 RepID=S9TUB9_9TRYP|nr:beta-ketoacyl-CoA synthase [Strigomonas culicis]EPY27631.1 beta-ketoacyl-CoA synthase [Strigomonas culicis]EPY30706.1 beta-ketoacyl-CoA synthase [Strigomonas culicis]|eukprot:EPY20139.1 beta-ketoacyl-CoA synthase [Strigomonas culicis]